MGLFERAEEEFVRTFAAAPASGPEQLTAEISRVGMLLDQRKLDEAFAPAASAVREADMRGEMLMGLTGRLYLVEIRLLNGEVETAESEALALSEIAGAIPYVGMWHRTVLACVRFAQGRVGEAAEIAEQALSQVRSCGMSYWNRHVVLLLVRAEALYALGDRPAACQVIREAQEDLLTRARKIPDPDVRRSFLENIPDHKRTLELARQWLGDDGETITGTAFPSGS